MLGTPLNGLQQLTETPDMLRALLRGVSDEQAVTRPSSSEWSVAEVLAHLSHVESHGFRLLIDQMVSEDFPSLPPYDQEALALSGQYSNHDPEDSLAHWEEQREDNLAWLESLAADAPGRTGNHGRLGTITVAQLVNEWAFHDMGHLRQIIQIVRKLRYYPGMGPLRTLYNIA